MARIHPFKSTNFTRETIIKGTRLSVELILELLSDGWTEKMLFESYPTLTENSLKAVFEDGIRQGKL